jgi:hypothetical protein
MAEFLDWACIQLRLHVEEMNRQRLRGRPLTQPGYEDLNVAHPEAADEYSDEQHLDASRLAKHIAANAKESVHITPTFLESTTYRETSDLLHILQVDNLFIPHLLNGIHKLCLTLPPKSTARDMNWPIITMLALVNSSLILMECF